MHRRLISLSIPALLTAPLQVCAQQSPKYLVVGTGTSFTFWEIVSRVVAYLSGAIAAIAVAMFIVGAFLITVSGVKEDYKQKGKDLIIGSVLSIAVVSGAYAILRTVDFFLS